MRPSPIQSPFLGALGPPVDVSSTFLLTPLVDGFDDVDGFEDDDVDGFDASKAFSMASWTLEIQAFMI